MSTSSKYKDRWFFNFQKIRFLTCDLREAHRIPAGSAWNIALKLRVLLLAKQNTRAGAGNSHKSPGNFPKTLGTSQTHSGLSKNTQNFPERPGNFPKHPWNFRTPRELPKNTWVGGG
jgi:hypothetical protein